MGVSIESFERDAKAAELIQALQRDGAVIVRERVDPARMDALVALLAPVLDPLEPGGGEFFGYRKKSCGELFANGREFSETLLLDPLVTEVSDTILGPNCHHYRVNASGSIQVWGGGENQPLHREMDIYRPFLAHDPERPEYVLATMWAGCDFTTENGATRLAPGSHLWPDGRRATEDEITQAVMPKGSLLFWLGKSFHGLGTNRTDEPRTGIIFTLTVDWLTQEENQFVAVPPEVARELPERAQQLLGYRASPLLGWVGGRDSDNLLRPARGKSGPLG